MCKLQILLQFVHISPVQDREHISIDASLEQVANRFAGFLEAPANSGEIIVRLGSRSHQVNEHTSYADLL